MPTLLVTNDFGPRIGGIEMFCRAVCDFLDDDVVVLTATQPGAAVFDAELAFPVIRHPGPLVPTPAIARKAREVALAHGCTRAIFGAAAPLGLLARDLRRVGVDRLVALTHGHEVWWASVPGARGLLRRIAADVDILTVVSAYTARRIGAALPSARTQILRLPPPVDLDLFRPGPVTGTARACVAWGRFVPQKGFRTLLAAWDLVGAEAGPKASLRLIGHGPDERVLRRRASRLRQPETVTFTGPIPHTRLPDAIGDARVFALPVRSLLGGLYAEGLGVSALEAAAAGLPVIVGDSGGAPETVIPDRTGYVVDPDDPAQLAARILAILADPQLALRLGLAGRRHAAAYSSGVLRPRLRTALGLPS